MPEGYARNFHKTLCRKLMNRIHQGMEYKEFEQPAGIEQISICSETGLLPRAGCPVTEEYFDVGTMPTDYCDQHFYDYDEDEEEMEIFDGQLTPTPDPENPDGTTENPDDGVIDVPDDGSGDGGDNGGEDAGADNGDDNIYYYD